MFRHAHLLGSMRFCKKGSQLSLQLKEACKPWIFIWISYKVIGKSCAQKSLYYLIIWIQHFVFIIIFERRWKPLVQKRLFFANIRIPINDMKCLYASLYTNIMIVKFCVYFLEFQGFRFSLSFCNTYMKKIN